MRRIVLILLLLVVFLWTSASADLALWYLNVGQADATFLRCDGQTLLIDGGEPGDSQFIYSFLHDTLELTHIDYIVSTHPHEDHAGGLAAALNACTVGKVYAAVKEYDSRAYRSFVKYLERQGLSINIPVRQESFTLGGALVTFLNEPLDDGNVNNLSLILRVDYGATSFLFTGDAEEATEQAVLESGVCLKADVLQVGHHGSSTSNSWSFLQAVDPLAAVISVGTENKYGHPHEIVLERLERLGATVLRTDEVGTIAMISDGEKIRYTTKSEQNKK